jgi:sigma-E factor negative regulatory protein RseB
MLSLIRADYQLGYAGTGVSLGHPALLVALRRGDGTLAARYWLDRQTSLPLRRQIFDSAGHLVSEGAYISLRLGETGDRELPTPRMSAWSPQPSADSAADLRALGWPVPASLGGLALVALTGSSESSGSVVDGSYSDGLSVVSVFFQRGQLPGSLAGWHLARISGEVVYSGEPDERSLTWSAHGFVYTVIADASPETVARVVAGLPHDSRDGGFWAQLGRGLRRIGSWFDPLG